MVQTKLVGFRQIQIIFLIFLFIIQSSCGPLEDLVHPHQKAEDLPLVLVHGSLASGDTYAGQFQRFSSNNYPENLMFAFDWNTLNQANAQVQLDAFIDSVIRKTGKTKVILAGHSAGSNLCYNYCNDAVRSQKIDKYIHLAGNPQSKPAGPTGQIPTLNIWSSEDLIVRGDSIPGAQNQFQTGLDHYQVATSPKVFELMYRFITGNPPTQKEIVPQTQPNIGGRVVSLGENGQVNGTIVSIYTLDPSTGFRMSAKPDTSLVPDGSGHWGPLSVNQGKYFEFEVSKPGDANFRTVHYYREPFIRNNPLIYLRTFPQAGSPLNFILSSLPKDDMQSVVAFFSSSQAVIHGRDQLKVNSFDLAIPALTSPNQSTIALFLYDEGDCGTSLEPKAIFSIFPFLKAADMFFSTENPASIQIEFNKRLMNVRNWKSGTEGVVIPVFD